MSRICPALQKLIDDKAVSPSSQIDLQTVNRRQRITWLLRRQVDDKTTVFDPVDETLERMNRRAAAGLPMVATEMKKSARVQKVAPKSRMVRVKKVKALAVKQPKAAKTMPAKASPPATPFSATVPPSLVATTSSLATSVILVFDESGSMMSQQTAINAQAEAIRQRLQIELAEASVSILRFGSDLLWAPAVSAESLQPIRLRSERGLTALNEAAAAAAEVAEGSGKATLIYILTDGDATDGGYSQKAKRAIASALATGRITFACVGPAAASSFFRACGIPSECIRQWDGRDTADLNKVTQQAAQGVSNYAVARSAGKTKLDSFFVDVVAAGLDVAKAKRELRDITSSLRRRKIGKFEEVKPYVENELKKVYVDGAAYYQLSKPETLLKGRRVILQPRSEEVFLAGPTARKLLGLPDDRDVKIEPKNLGEFVMYVQSASPNRKLLPGTTFLYDESHVPGATEPTWFRKGA